MSIHNESLLEMQTVELMWEDIDDDEVKMLANALKVKRR
jgi:hypothetical protein